MEYIKQKQKELCWIFLQFLYIIQMFLLVTMECEELVGTSVGSKMVISQGKKPNFLLQQEKYKINSQPNWASLMEQAYLKGPHSKFQFLFASWLGRTLLAGIDHQGPQRTSPQVKTSTEVTLHIVRRLLHFLRFKHNLHSALKSTSFGPLHPQLLFINILFLSCSFYN